MVQVACHWLNPVSWFSVWVCQVLVAQRCQVQLQVPCRCGNVSGEIHWTLQSFAVNSCRCAERAIRPFGTSEREPYTMHSFEECYVLCVFKTEDVFESWLELEVLNHGDQGLTKHLSLGETQQIHGQCCHYLGSRWALQVLLVIQPSVWMERLKVVIKLSSFRELKGDPWQLQAKGCFTNRF